MKRGIYLLIGVAVFAVLAVFLYPRLSGNQIGTADAQQTASGNASSASAPKGSGDAGRTRGAGATSVVVAVAAQQSLPITSTELGYVVAPNVAVLRTRADGVVLQQDVVEGQMVKAGDVLFKLDDRAAQAVVAKDQATIAKDQANFDESQKDLARDNQLAKNDAGTQQAADTQAALVKADQAQLQADQATLQGDQLTVGYMTITAPIDGRVGQINTSVGNVVRAADTSAGGLLTITQMSKLRVSYSVAESDLDQYRQALANKLPVSILAQGDTAPRATGTLSFIDSSVDQASGTVATEADVTGGADKLWPGQYVTIITRLGEYSNATTIPLVAVEQSDSGSYVFAVGADKKVKRVPLAIQAALGDTAIVTGSPIKPGDHVVVEGQLRLADGSPVNETIAANTAPATPATPAAPADGSPAAVQPAAGQPAAAQPSAAQS
jgi:multidrug efflux system membrane fusion protein